MIENWNSLLLGGIGGIATSSIVQYVRYKLDRKQEREREEREWFMDIITTTRALRRRAGDLDASIDLDEGVRTKSPEDIDNEEVSHIVSLLQELRGKHDRMPIQFYDTRVDRSLSKLTRYYESDSVGENSTDIVEFKRELRNETRKTLDAIQDEYEDAPELY